MDGSPLGVLDRTLADQLQAWEEEPDLQRAEALGRAMAERYKDLAPAMFLNLRVGAIVAHRRVLGLGEPGTVVPVLGFRHPWGDLTKLRLDGHE